VWILAALSARLSRVGSQVELHITGLRGAELAPDHLRQILTAPTTEFKSISFAGVLSAIAIAVVLRKQSPPLLRRITLSIAVLAFGIVAAGYGR
jgi:NO-binding membrane sensor protein with MHYT domain